MRRHCIVVILLCQAAGTQQQPATDPVEQDYDRLIAQFEPLDGEPPEHAVQLKAMLAFLERHGKEPTHHRLLQMRIRLGTALLHACEFESASAQFEAVLAVPQAQRDLLAGALYGRAQSFELLGEAAKARKDLERLIDAHAGERYARFAKTALQRLADTSTTGARANQPAPELNTEPVLDLDGQAHKVSAYADRPLLLVFWSPDAPASITRLKNALEAWQLGGGSPKTVLAVALFRSTLAVERVRKEHGLTMPILVCSDEFVHPAALAYRVAKLPTVVMIAPGGTIVGRDLPNKSIERLAQLLH